MRLSVTAVLLGSLAGTSCRCGSLPDLGGVELGFRVSGATVDFGRVLEGAQVVRQVTLYSESRAETAVAVTTEGAFAAPAEVAVPAGGSVDLPVTFTAGDGRVVGVLLLVANAQSVRVPLMGEGVRPLPCVPAGPCRTSRFDLYTGRCIEGDAPEAARCTPADECLENGTCRGGLCLGTPRSCNDQNKCTSDACAPGIGCVHTPIECPAPTALCRVATCDPSSGCGEGPAPDESICGPVDCKTSNLCIGGVCKQLATVDGVRCSPATPCQGPGVCKSQVCARPDAGQMTPEYALSVPFPPVGDLREEPVLLAHQGNLFWQTCGDGGVDAGCFLSSFTGTGFQRFFAPLDDAGPVHLAQVGDGGVVLVREGGLWILHVGTGQPLASLSFDAPLPPDAGRHAAQSAPGRVARAATGELLAAVDFWRLPDERADAGAADGGEEDAGPPLFAGQALVRYELDGGRLQLPLPKDRASRIAVDVEGGVHLYGADGAWLSVDVSDGGARLRGVADVPTGTAALLTYGGRVLLGGRALHALDGGLVADLGPDAGGAQPLPLFSVAGRGELYVFDRRCDAQLQSCPPDALTPYVRAFDGMTGAPVWTLPLGLAPGAALLETAAGDLNTLLTLTEEAPDAGSLPVVQLSLGGRRLYACPLPAEGRVGGAVFSRGFLYVLVERAGGWRLEAYDLAGTPTTTGGWPQRFGVSGQRRALP